MALRLCPSIHHQFIVPPLRHSNRPIRLRNLSSVRCCISEPNDSLKKHNPSEDEKLSVFLIEKALAKLPAGSEEILGIFDLRGFGAQNADLKFLTFVFDMFYNYYPRRLGQVLFVDAPFVFKPIWQLAKPLLKSYASLVRFCSVEDVKKEYFTESTLPTTFRD